jgi:hypothetical protein
MLFQSSDPCMHNLAIKNGLHNILLVQIGLLAELPSRVFGFRLMLRIGFCIISRLPALSSALVRHMHLGGRRGGKGQQMAGGRGESGRKQC